MKTQFRINIAIKGMLWTKRGIYYGAVGVELKQDIKVVVRQGTEAPAFRQGCRSSRHSDNIMLKNRCLKALKCVFLNVIIAGRYEKFNCRHRHYYSW